jgi:murein DD-endopeptidase MepM/ murein hydrolase activator NlpD
MEQKRVNPDSIPDSNEAALLKTADSTVQAAPEAEEDLHTSAPLSDKVPPVAEAEAEKEPNALPTLLAWMLAIIVCGSLLSFLIWQPDIARALAEQSVTAVTPAYTAPENLDESALAAMPVYAPTEIPGEIARIPQAHTAANKAYRAKAIEYTVVEGDNVTFISEQFGIEPITILYNNYPVLNDQMDFLKVGDVLSIAPADGIWYKWRNKDTIDSVASKFGTSPDAIKLFPGNDIDLSNPKVAPGSFVMIPGGSREIIEQALPVMAGVTGGSTVGIPAGPNVCSSSGGYLGTGGFIWPSATHFISGNAFGPGHNGIDIGAGEGSPIFASDGGTVVYSGWLEPGYGYMVEIDHGNGFYTIYEHLMNYPDVSPCQSVNQGQVIGYTGNTGNSFGAHIHFGILTAAGPVNPGYYLP